jgi:hypothetical protein
MKQSNLFLFLTVLLFAGCGPIANTIVVDNMVEYEYFADTLTNNPYSELYEQDSTAYVVQFPGHDPNESFLYGTDYLAYLFVGAKGNYSIHNLWVSLFNNGHEIIPYRSSYISDKASSRRETKIIVQSDPPRELDFDYTYNALIGFSFRPEQLKGIINPELRISFDIFEGEKTEKIEKHFQLSRSKITKNAAHHMLGEADPEDVFLSGPWWLGWGMKSKTESFDEYIELLGRAKTDSKAAFRVSGRGFLPCIRYGRFHKEGFFLHMDR